MRRRTALAAGAGFAMLATFVVACAENRVEDGLGVDAYMAELGAPSSETSVQEPLALGNADAGSPPPSDASDAAPSYDESGCLTAAGSTRVCTSRSDDSICALLASCNALAIDSCRQLCERSASARCWSANDVECLRDAALARSCAALARCGVP